MKTKFKNISVIVVLTITIMFQSCSSEEEDVIIGDNNELSNIQTGIEEYQEAIDSMEPPEAMSGYAQESTHAFTAISSMRSLQAQALQYSSIFLAIPSDAEPQGVLGKGVRETNTWVWSFGGVTLYYTVTSDDDFYNFQYDIEENGERVNLYTGRIRKDGTFYEVEFFAGQEETLLKLAYTKTGNSVNIRLESAECGRVELNYNETDRSGSVEIYEFDSLVAVSYTHLTLPTILLV